MQQIPIRLPSAGHPWSADPCSLNSHIDTRQVPPRCTQVPLGVLVGVGVGVAEKAFSVTSFDIHEVVVSVMPFAV